MTWDFVYGFVAGMIVVALAQALYIGHFLWSQGENTDRERP